MLCNIRRSRRISFMRKSRIELLRIRRFGYLVNREEGYLGVRAPDPKSLYRGNRARINAFNRGMIQALIEQN